MKIQLTILILFSFFTTFGQTSFSEIYHEYEDLDFITGVNYGDLNGDGVADFILSSLSTDNVLIGINDNLQKPSFVSISQGLDIRNIAVHDFDQDGDMDIIGSAVFDNEAYVWKNDGAANFTRELLPIADYSAIHFADMNGDNVIEMILGIDDQIKIYSIIGGAVVLLTTVHDDGPLALDVFDYDNDGVMDIAAAFGIGGVKVFRQSNNLNFSEIAILPATFNNDEIVASDMNGDLVPDFLLFSKFNTRTTILLSDVAGDYTAMVLPEIDGTNKFSAFGYIDQDSIMDIFYHLEENQVTGANTVFYGGNNMTASNLQIINDNYANLGGGGITDLDNDGDNDIFIYANDLFNEGLVFFINDAPADSDNDGFASDVDCDDTNPNINPDQTEITYNNIDDDCDPSTLDDDLDEDGFLLADDCDDINPNINPGQTEIAYNNLDDDCDPTTLDDDLDEDGFLLADDCDDTNPDINPNGTEIPNNGIDEDCTGSDLMVATHELSNMVIDIFPNPTSEKINLVLPVELNLSIKLYDVTGQLLFSGSNSPFISMHHLTAGIYLLEVSDVSTQQFIREKIVLMK